MKMKNLVAFAMLALGVVGLGLTAEADTNGDIYEIERIEGETRGFPSAEAPITNAGPVVRFVIHLAAKDADSVPPGDSHKNWYLAHPGTGSQPVDDVMNPLRIGVVVSGKLRWATLVWSGLNNEFSTYDYAHKGCGAIYDAVFEYKTEPGDYAMPIRLALEGSTPDNPIAAFGTAANFAFQNKYDPVTQTGKWWFQNDDGENATFKLIDGGRASTISTMQETWKRTSSDLTLAESAFYVRTVNFLNADPAGWEKPGEYWTSVEQGSGRTTAGHPAALKVSSMPSDELRLYAWTTNDAVVTMSGGKKTKMGMPPGGDTTNEYAVATIDIFAGKDEYAIPLRGVTVSEKPVDVFVSQYPGFRYKSNGQEAADWITVPVRCVEAPKPGVRISFDREASDFKYNNGEAIVAPYDSGMPTPIPMYVTLSDFNGLSAEKFPDGVDVELNAQLLKDAYKGDDVYTNKYVWISLDTSDTGDEVRRVHFEPGQYQVPIYLFVRGGDGKTASGLTFKPTSTNEAFNTEYTGDRVSAQIFVRDAYPLLQLPENEQMVTADAITGFNLDVQVLDCYRDMMSTNFTVRVGSQELKNVEFARDMATKCHFNSPGNETEYRLPVSVTDQNGNTTTNKATIVVTVTPAKTVTVDFMAKPESEEPVKGTTYYENSNATFSKVDSGEILQPIPRFTLSEQNSSGGTLYAFLVPQSEAASNYVACAAFTEGVPIPLYDRQSEPNDKFKMIFLDGCADTSYLEFAIVLRKGPKLTDEAYTEFAAPKNANLTVKNVKPEIVRLTYNGTELDSGATVHVSDGIKTSFTMTIDDASKHDLTNGTQKIVTVWRFQDDAGQTETKYVTNTVGKTVTCDYTFIGGGSVQKVEVYAYDKDMDPETERGEVFTINVAVDDSPYVYFASSKDWDADASNKIDEWQIYENDALGKRYVWVMLSAPAATKYTEKDPLKVKLEIERLGNSGWVELSVTNLTFMKGAKGGGTAYRVAFSNVTSDKLPDGGEEDDSFFKITATPSWKAGEEIGYTGGELELAVIDVAPTIVKPSERDGSHTNGNITAGSTVTIPFKARDIAADAKLSVLVEGLSGSSEVENYVSDVDTNLTYTFSDTDSGLQEVVITVTDKDGYSSSRSMWYEIPAFKSLRLTPYGASATSQSRYNGVTPGLGNGAVLSNGNRPQTNDAGRVTYYFAEKTDLAEASAWGLSGTEEGGIPGYDSFFYCWVLFGTGEKEGGSGAQPQTPNPVDTVGAVMPLDVKLDPFQAGKDAYMPTSVEAIFARELYPADNMGDINADGIPDLYVRFYKLDGEGTQPTTTDLKPITANYNGNIDGDYLPSMETSPYGALIPGLKGTWVTLGTPFTAKMEIRGYHDGLNDAPQQVKVGNAKPDRIYEMPDGSYNAATCTISRLEYLAWKKSGLPADKWSPERPTDPTMDDTDDDGFTDGYEYYFWYRAHVGYLENEGSANERHRYLTGRRYNPAKPGEPDLITSAEIAELMDPRVSSGDKSGAQTRDTDNDGLPDLTEFELGTNPFDFDTDGDGLPDGYEVMLGAENGFDPLLWSTAKNAKCDAEQNADGDTMAEFVAEMQTVGIAQKDGSTVYYATEGTGFETALGAEAAGTGTVIRAVNEDGTHTNFYLTTSAVTTNVLEGKIILTCDLGKEVTWRARVTETNTVRGASVRLERGTTFGGEVTIEEEQEFFDEIVTAVPDLYWSTWTYGVGGGLAIGKENLHHDGLKADETILSNRVAEAVGGQSVRFLHYQVFQQVGFDPRTGWKRPPDSAQCVNTRLYTALDEFLLMAFFHQDGVLDASELVPSQQRPFTDIWMLYCTDPLKADTDDDGMPDGWELYVMSGPKTYGADEETGASGDRVYDYGPRLPHSPLMPFGEISDASLRDNDGDGLEWPNEYSGFASSAEYSETCASIVNLKPEWRNKKWPTDPWNGDTDGDGLLDGEEGTHFIYGDPEAEGMAGGGLDPLSWDTDADFLPDPWEVEFAGTAKTTPGSTTATVGANGETNITMTAARADWNMDGMDGTVDDARLDYDSDGLSNWQEYMTGAVRAWRYDDTVSPWGNLSLELDQFGSLITPDPSDAEAWGKFWGDLLVNPLSDTFNPRLVNGRFDGAQAYFSTPTNAFEQATVKGFVYMFKDGIYHDLKTPTDPRYKVGDTQFNRFTFKPAMTDHMYAIMLPESTQPIYPTKYICCDPTNPDSDFDGMDDYYEVFHGLNPLLGERERDKYAPIQPLDVIYWSYGGDKVEPWSAGDNYWIDNPWKELRTKGLSGVDFEVFPWLAGEAKADPDGDNIRNQQEAIMPNVQAASTYLHSDPTPLWMTDSSYSLSIPRRYYLPGISKVRPFPGNGDSFVYEGREYHFSDFPWFSYNADSDSVAIGYDFNDKHFGVNSYHFSFEENEGYDSDHDYLSDFEEAQGKTKPASDPQDHDDPLRRQAMYFNGTDAFLQTPLPAGETVPESPAGSEPRQNFLYYTVECWAKADAASLKADNLTRVLVERAIVTGESNPGDEQYLRKNFQLGVRNGLWYTKFDSTGTDRKQAEEITDGPAATTEWTHLAATYDGTMLRLYVNGRCPTSSEKRTKVQPEHGSCAIRVNDAGEITPGQINYSTISILVGAGAKTTQGVTFDACWRGYSSSPTTIDDYTGFFKGYVDEVTIWDGARSGSEILADCENRVRMNRDLALENRQKVYDSWLKGARRSPVSEEQLPPQLMYHWAFDHVAGAILPEDLMKVPAGFDSAYNVIDAKAIWSRPEGWVNPWRASASAFDPSIRSTVFTDNAWVPWINDTVAHLPRFDKTTLDSIYWSEDFAGAEPSEDFGYRKFAFARRAEVYSKWTQQTYDTEHQAYSLTVRTRWDIVNSASNDVNLAEAYRFARRDRMLTGFDLLPFGGAYPRRISAAEGGMWDDQGASDAWAETGKDSNNNGLPDWWEEYARNNYCEDLDPLQPLEWDTPVTYNGFTLRAWQAYLRDLASGMVKEGNKIGVPEDGDGNAIYADTRDVEANGIPDWWEEFYGIPGESGLDDHDNDGLPNYVEYLLSEVFDFKVMFNPVNPYSVQSEILDYFYRPEGCQLYVGEIFTDHDRMYDAWEDQYPVGQLSRLVYDAYGDPDGDGWSNVSEMLADTDPTRTRSLGLEDQVIAEYPVPMIRTRVKVPDNLPESISIIVQAFSKSIDGRPDAVWKTDAGEDSFAKEKFIGTNPGGVKRFYLSPGSISPGNVSIAFKDESAVTYTYTVIDGKMVLTKSVITGSGWQNCVSDKLRSDGGIIGDLVKYTGEVVGWINYATGEIELDFTDAALQTASYLGETGTAGTGDNAQATEERTVLDLTHAYVKFSWSAKLVKQGSMSELYLSDADEGYVREGKNTFIAWADKDGSGTWQPGEPYGIVRDVDVSWSGTTAEIELTDLSPVTPRILLAGSSEGGESTGPQKDGGEGTDGDPDELDPASDRGRTLSSITARLRQNLEYEYSGRTTTVAYSNALARLEWIDKNSIETTSFAADEFREQRLRVVRWLINGVPAYRAGSNMRTVLDKKIRTDLKTSITEADFLVGNGNVFDLDWNDLYREVADNTGVLSSVGNVTEVSYLVVVGDGPADWNIQSTNNYAVKALNTVIVRKFGKTRVTPVAVAPGAEKEEIVYSANPTFKWTMDCPENEGYTAFNVQVLDGTTVIYDSDKQLAPPRNAEGQYEWTAPLYVGDRTMKGTVFENKRAYTWQVAMYNAKFSDAAKYSKTGKFLMQVQTNGYEYGSANVGVRYFGPKSSYQKSYQKKDVVIRVRAYTSPDFTGLPVAAGYVANPDDPASGLTAGTNAVPNCTVIGIPRGTYYLQAFIDSNGNGVCDKWETQGYLCTRDGTTSDYLDPTAITFDSRVGKGSLAIIYLEDADTDGDGLPDAWEYAEYGSLTAKGVELLTETMAGELVVNTDLSGTLALQKNAKAPTAGLAGEIGSRLNNAGVLALAMGAKTEGYDSFAAAIRGYVSPELVEDGVRIVSLDIVDGKVSIKVEAETETAGSAWIKGSKELTVWCQVQWKQSLTGTDWMDLGKPFEITVGTEKAEEIDISDRVPEGDSGYFSVRVYKK